MSGESDDKSVSKPASIELEIARAADKTQTQSNRIRIARLIPPELLFAFVVLLTLGCTIVIWTDRIVMRDAAARYEDEALWQLRSPKPTEQADFLAQEMKRRQNLLSAAQKAGPGYTQALLALGDLYLASGKWDLATSCFDNALKSTSQSDSNKSLLTSIYLSLGRASFELGQTEQSIHWLLLARAAAESDKVAQESPLAMHILEELVLAYSDSDNLVAAKKACQTLIANVTRPDDASLVIWKCQLADLERRMKDDVGAERLFRGVLIDLSRRPQSAGPDIARARFGLALSCAQQGDNLEANRNYKLALAQAEKSEGPGSPLVQSIRHAYAYSLWKTNWIAALAMTFASGDRQR